MSQQGKSAEVRFIADAAAVNIGLGFKPDFAILAVNLGGTNPNLIIYSKQLEDTQTIYGLLLTGSSGIITRITSAASGLAALDAKYHQVMVESPVPGKGEVPCDVSDWAAGTSYASGARSATAIGTIIRPPTHNGYVYELTTASGNGTTAPSSWGTTPGGATTDGGSNVWTCREEKVITKGAQGLTMGASVASDNNVCSLWALGFDVDRNAGDAAEVGANAAI